MSLREIVVVGSCRDGNMPSGNRLQGIFRVTNCRVRNCRLGSCRVGNR